MFDTLTQGFRQALNRLSGLTQLTESTIEPALREVRVSLLEADVELGVVKNFLARVREKALGETVQTRIKHEGEVHRVSASDVFVKICHDELVQMLQREDGDALTWAPHGKVTHILMVGLQGAGKTTSAAKLARLVSKQGKKPLLVAADLQRPAAVEQLKILGQKIAVPVATAEAGEGPLELCSRAFRSAAGSGHDVVIYDTAGRLAIDEPLMQELQSIQEAVSPQNIFLVVDAMIGQDAVQTARAFHDRVGISRVILTKLDGDARGGAALSVKHVTGATVAFVGMGETIDKFEEFRPEGMASRILGMGDVVGLMKDFEEVVDTEKAAKDALRMMEGQLTLDDLVEQLRTIRRMGSLKDLVDKIPGLSGNIPSGVNLDDGELTKIEAIVQSMTRIEKRDPHVLVREPKRVSRIAGGSGTPEKAVQELVQRFISLQQMMSQFTGGGGGGLLGKIPGMKQMAALKNMRKAMASGSMPDFGDFPGMGGMGFPGLGGMPGFPGMGTTSAESLPKMKTLSTTEKNAKKAQRRREKDSRKKNRK